MANHKLGHTLFVGGGAILRIFSRQVVPVESCDKTKPTSVTHFNKKEAINAKILLKNRYIIHAIAVILAFPNQSCIK
jgi:hypothetical protein